MSLDGLKLKIGKAYKNTEYQRDRANEDFRFCNVDGGMWEGWLNDTHNDQTKRARMEFDLVSNFVNRYYGEWTQNRANVSFTPNDEATTEDDADRLSGIYRGDFKDNSGQVAQDNAVGEVAECGYGAFKLSTEFEDSGDPENDKQNAIFTPLFNAYSNVIWDMNAKRAEKKDAKWGTILTTYTPEAFEDAFPDAIPASAFTPTTRQFMDWATPKLITVAEHYEVVKKKTVVHVYQHIEAGKVEAYDQAEVKLIEDELKAGGWEFVRKRRMVIQTVEKSIFSGEEFLEVDGVKQESVRIAGKFIPIIPMYGYRKYVDGLERFRGLVRKLKDANRLFNSSVSRIAESAAGSGDTKPVFEEDEIEGLESTWANTTNKAYMVKRKLLDQNGNRVFKPMEYLQPTQIDPNTVASSEIVNNYVQLTTGNAPQDTIDPDASGKAINALRQRENLNTQTMTDNILVSIKHSGDVWLSIAEEIYQDQRTKRSIGVDDKVTMQKINTRILDEETGVFVAGNTLKGRFKVDVEVGPQYESQREATVETLERVIEMIGPENEFFRPALTMYLKNITGTGLKEFQAFVRRVELQQGLAKPQTEEEQQMVQQMSQQTDPNKELAEAATRQQDAEARSLDASAEQKLADTMKKKAETVKILDEVGNVDTSLLQRTTAQLN